MRQRTRRRQSVVFAVAVVVTVALVSQTRWTHHSAPRAAAQQSPSPATTPAATPESTSARPSPSPSSSPSSSTTPVSHQAQAEVRAEAVSQISALTRGLAPGSYSVAALNMATGASYSAGATSGMWTASAYKLFVLEILLQRAGGPLSGSEGDEAVPMIENSDNVAGYEEFENAGGRSGLQDGFGDLGLRSTVAGVADPAFTTTSAMDGITLLRDLVQGGPLTPASRAYALNLMENVEADQRWGVGVDADPGDDFANKNGWLSIDDDNGPGEDDNGLWAVTSLGVIRIHGQQVLMAVMTRHDPDVDSGVALVEALARAMKPLISAA